LRPPAAPASEQPVSRSDVHHARDARRRRLREPAGGSRRRARGERDLLLLHRRGEHGRRARVAHPRQGGNGRGRARRGDGARAHLPAERHHRRSWGFPATAPPPPGPPPESEGYDMRFSIYTEVQSWPGISYDRLYGEVLEQIENADRLGYDAYAAVEHFFFPKFSASANPFGLFGMAASRTRRINFRTMLHVLPYHNPLVLAAMIHEFSLLTRGRYP